MKPIPVTGHADVAQKNDLSGLKITTRPLRNTGEHTKKRKRSHTPQTKKQKIGAL